MSSYLANCITAEFLITSFNTRVPSDSGILPVLASCNNTLLGSCGFVVVM